MRWLTLLCLLAACGPSTALVEGSGGESGAFSPEERQEPEPAPTTADSQVPSDPSETSGAEGGESGVDSSSSVIESDSGKETEPAEDDSDVANEDGEGTTGGALTGSLETDDGSNGGGPSRGSTTGEISLEESTSQGGDISEAEETTSSLGGDDETSGSLGETTGFADDTPNEDETGTDTTGVTEPVLCIIEDHLVDTQEEVDALAGCEHLQGDVIHFYQAAITDLSPLSSVVDIYALELKFSETSLTTLAPLSNVETFRGNLVITSNASLTTLGGAFLSVMDASWPIVLPHLPDGLLKIRGNAVLCNDDAVAVADLWDSLGFEGEEDIAYNTGSC